ncbi:MAG: MucR family transcriptional regulator [Sphingorhabdus sp.]|jgi:predicted transcriptional regulator|nr:MucR family transcriptional regulator [Sphingorhabdus sp.]
MTEAHAKSELLVTLTADIVSAHVSNNSVAVNDLASLIGNVHSALIGLAGPSVPVKEALVPFVPVKNSVKPTHIVCLNCGEKMKMLKRHLNTHHGLTPEEYSAQWELPKNYPFVAPDYAERRRELAISIGLGKGGRGSNKRK